MATPLSGPGSTRRLGTEAGTLRREARKLERAGGNPQRLLEAAAISNLRDGSISSAESNIAEAAFQRRTDAGLGAARQGLLREMAAPTAPSPATGGGSTPSVVGGTATPYTPYRTSNGLAFRDGAGVNIASPPSVTGGSAPALPPNQVMADPGADRRANARQGVLRDVLARSAGPNNSTTRTGALEQINKERVAAGMPSMEFSNAEFAASGQARSDARMAAAGTAGRNRVLGSQIDESLDALDTWGDRMDGLKSPSSPVAAAPAPTSAAPAATPSRASALNATPVTRTTPLRQLAFTTAEARRSEDERAAELKRNRRISGLRDQKQRTNRESDESIDKSFLRDTAVGDVLKFLSKPRL